MPLAAQMAATWTGRDMNLTGLHALFAEKTIPVTLLAGLLASNEVVLTPVRAGQLLDAFLTRFPEPPFMFYRQDGMKETPDFPTTLDADWTARVEHGHDEEEIAARLWAASEQSPLLAVHLRQVVLAKRWSGLYTWAMSSQVPWSACSPWRDESTGKRALKLPWMHALVMGGNTALVERWLNHPAAQPHQTDAAGKTALFYASQYPSIVKLLLDHGMDPTHTSDSGQTLLAAWRTKGYSSLPQAQSEALLVQYAPRSHEDLGGLWTQWQRIPPPSFGLHPQGLRMKGVQGDSTIVWQPLAYVAQDIGYWHEKDVVDTWKTCLTATSDSTLRHESIAGLPDSWWMEVALTAKRSGDINPQRRRPSEDLRSAWSRRVQQLFPDTTAATRMLAVMQQVVKGQCLPKAAGWTMTPWGLKDFVASQHEVNQWLDTAVAECWPAEIWANDGYRQSIHGVTADHVRHEKWTPTDTTDINKAWRGLLQVFHACGRALKNRSQAEHLAKRMASLATRGLLPDHQALDTSTSHTHLKALRTFLISTAKGQNLPPWFERFETLFQRNLLRKTIPAASATRVTAVGRKRL